MNNDNNEICEDCNGTGTREINIVSAGVEADIEVICAECVGTGKIELQ